MHANRILVGNSRWKISWQRMQHVACSIFHNNRIYVWRMKCTMYTIGFVARSNLAAHRTAVCSSFYAQICKQTRSTHWETALIKWFDVVPSVRNFPFGLATDRTGMHSSQTHVSLSHTHTWPIYSLNTCYVPWSNAKNIEINSTLWPNLFRPLHSVIRRSLYPISSVLDCCCRRLFFLLSHKFTFGWTTSLQRQQIYARTQNGGKQFTGAPCAPILKIATHKVQMPHTKNRFDGTCSKPMNMNCIYRVCEYARGFAMDLIRWMREKRLSWGTVCRWKSNNNHSELVNWQLHAMQIVQHFTSSIPYHFVCRCLPIFIS